MLDIIGIGNPVVDIMTTPEGKKETFGGNAANTIVNLARLGMKTGIIGYVGRDKYGLLILEEFRKAEIDVSPIRLTKHTFRVEVKVTAKDRKIRIISYKTVDELSPQDIAFLKNSSSFFARLDHGVFGSCAEIMEKQNGIMFASLHGVKRTQEKEKVLLKSRVHVLFANEEEYKEFSNILKKKDSMIVVTRGKKGCVIFNSGAKNSYRGFGVKSVDSTGAGDAFAAGFIYSFLKGWDADTTAYFANACGALATTEFGARTKVITKEEAFSLIRSAGIKIPEKEKNRFQMNHTSQKKCMFSV